MTSHSGIPIVDDALVDATERATGRIGPGDVPVSMRMWARLFPTRYDQQVDRQLSAVARTPLAAHYLRLTSRRERENLATTLTLVLRDANQLPGERNPSARVPIRVEAVQQSADVVRDVVAWLLGPRPVHARGMARLRLLVSDGRGPLYRLGQGSLAAAMRGVLAAL